MGEPIELDADLADVLRTDARERGFADAEAYLVWLVSNRQQLFEAATIVDRLEAIERRLDRLEEQSTAAGQAESNATRKPSDDGFWNDEHVTEVLDEALAEPGGAGDGDVAAAISDIEDNLETQ